MLLYRGGCGGTDFGGADVLRERYAFAAAALASFWLTSCDNPNSESCAAPLPGWIKPSDGIGHLRFYIRIIVAKDGQIFYSGQRISLAKMKHYLDRVGTFEPEPQIILQFDSRTPCDTVKTIRRIMNETKICKTDRFCGEGRGWLANPDLGGKRGIPMGF